MEAHIKAALKEKHLILAGKYYDVTLSELKYHGGFENFVYIFEKDKIEYILRLVHSDHRSYNQVLAEIEFIDYLAHHNACVSTVIHSVDNHIVEKVFINETDYFTVSVFVRGLGGRISNYLKDPEFWENLGEQIGLLHHLTKTFKPKHKRLFWHEENLYHLATKYLEDDPKVLQKLYERINKIKTFEITKDNFGLIHTDLHIGNMVIDDLRNLTFFDFDDSAYKHFISDIAIVIFYNMAYQNPDIETKTKKTIWILNNFMVGYERKNHLPKEEMKHLNDFLKLRELTLYTAIKAGGEEVIQSDWGAHFLKIYQEKIINDVPFVDMEELLNNLKY